MNNERSNEIRIKQLMADYKCDKIQKRQFLEQLVDDFTKEQLASFIYELHCSTNRSHEGSSKSLLDS